MNRSVRALSTALVAVVALVLAGLMSPAGAATSTAKITGVVTLDGVPVRSATVQLFRTVREPSDDEARLGKRLKTVRTNRTGRYGFAGLKAGSGATNRYVVLVSDRSGQSVKKYWGVAVRKGKTSTANIRLDRAATLTGAIGTADGRSPAGLSVQIDVETDDLSGRAYRLLRANDHTTVRADGTFALTGVPAGTYEVQVLDDGRAPECYDVVGGTLGDCTTIPVARQHVSVVGGQVVTLPTVTKTTFGPAATTLSGRVTRKTGKPIKGVEVSVSRAGSTSAVATAVTRSTGRFRITERLDAGRYVVRYRDPKKAYRGRTFAGGVVQVVVGTPVRGLDAELRLRSSR